MLQSDDRKVACETTISAAGDGDPGQLEEPAAVPDYAPESFWLSKDAELDWLDENAFFERKDSGKGSVISISNSSSLNPNPNSAPATGSQRYSGHLKSKASIIGLPKPQKPNYAVDRRKFRPASIRLFPRPAGGRAPAVSEPSSPKVSCMGRVRSRKDRSRRGKNRKKPVEPGVGLARTRSVKQRKTGFWSNFRLIFRAKGGKTGCKQPDESAVEPVVRRTGSKSDRKRRGFVVSDDAMAGSSEPPGLGGVKRFASGRRSDAWAGDLEVDGARSEPLNRDGGGSIWHRRDRGPPKEVIVERDWHAAGPASV